MSNACSTSLLVSLELPETLRVRINPSHDSFCFSPTAPSSFVLYLPTVVLRKKHNPAFALACRLANCHQVPLLVLAVVLDDAHLPLSPPKAKPIAATSRRLAFVLEALQKTTQEWEEHGAGVAIRVHGAKARMPHHLTLARNAVAVVTDEPFVHPFLSYCQAAERATRVAGVPCYRVDGSTTVPPISILEIRRDGEGSMTGYKGVPSKAWMWQKKTESQRKAHVYGAVQDGHLDAPELKVKLPPNFFLSLSSDHDMHKYIPAEWRSVENAAPGHRAWTVEELASIINLKDWALTWPGADASVRPCQQTCGSSLAGQERWNNFLGEHLSSYAKLRNQCQRPHAVSRMSCYLNYGIVSIFQIIHDIWQQKSTEGNKKFQDEIIKWREMSYAHAFSTPATYNREASVPEWARCNLNQCRQQQSTGQSQYSLQQLEEGDTECDKWNAMQRYLVETGELHNNVRMTWSKTVVHWQKWQLPVDNVLQQLIYLNDRFALDGLSPPSYAGILWCFGWCDKPNNGVLSEKPSSRYRVAPEGFREAAQILLSSEKQRQQSIADMLPRKKKQRRENPETTTETATITPSAARPTTSNTLFQYFHQQKSPK